MKKHFTFLFLFTFLVAPAFSQNAATFDELTVGAGGYWNGSDLSGSFKSGPYTFRNNFNVEWASWAGFSYTNHKDTVTPGLINQYSAITGGGIGGAGIYSVAYVFGTTRFSLAKPDSISGMYLTNSTYAYLVMRDGDDFGKKFGGISGNDPDYFRLVINGIDADGDTTGTVVFYLADFRFEDNTKDYILKTWKWVDLKELGIVSEVHFALQSTDVGAWGMNTPGYFCLDNVNRKDFTSSQVQLPSALADVKLFPNPVRQNLTVQLPEGDFTLDVRDIQGRLIFQTNERGNSTVAIDAFQEFRPGIYFLTVRSGQLESRTFKLQKVN
jgi:hypothetical protein